MIQLAVSLPRQFAEGAGALTLDLTLTAGSLTAIVGPSGSGKTTLLRLLAGLETPQQGRIMVGEDVWFDHDRRVNWLPQRRSVGYVFQDTALFPNLSVRENIAYAAGGQRDLINQLIDATGLRPFADNKPATLSGGQRQRVALARALVRRPQLLLLDEPFAALDADAAAQLRTVLLDLHRAWGTTTLLVSHHAADVQALADRIIRLEQGRVAGDKPAGENRPLVLAEERVERCYIDATGQWVIETMTAQVRSANPAWQQVRPGDVVQLTKLNSSEKS